ncbi:MAG: endo alpha-1,4 polygalactosaminidase [Alphaproteobacteria bacterium]
MTRRFALAALAGLATLPRRIAAAATSSVRWTVIYTDKVDPAALLDYTVIVLDSTHHPPLAPLSGRIVMGYASLGEVENWRPWFARARDAGIVLDENRNWPGSFFVDVRSRAWQDIVLDTVVPNVMSQGFGGVFFDTLDNPPHLERTDPKRYAGMTRAAASLVEAVRLQYPQARLMLNRGYELLPLVGGAIDYALGESVYADWDFDKKAYRLVEHATYQEQVRLLQAARRQFPGLQVMTLDYWDPADRAGLRRIYRAQRANGFSPYVATVELDRLVPEPGR